MTISVQEAKDFLEFCLAKNVYSATLGNFSFTAIPKVEQGVHTEDDEDLLFYATEGEPQ